MGVCVGCSAEVADDQLKDGMCPACTAKQGGGEAAAPAEGGDMGGDAAPAEGGDAPAGDAPAEGGDAM